MFIKLLYVVDVALDAEAIRTIRALFFLSRGSQGSPRVDTFAGGGELLKGIWVRPGRAVMNKSEQHRSEKL